MRHKWDWSTRLKSQVNEKIFQKAMMHQYELRIFPASSSHYINCIALHKSIQTFNGFSLQLDFDSIQRRRTKQTIGGHCVICFLSPRGRKALWMRRFMRRSVSLNGTAFNSIIDLLGSEKSSQLIKHSECEIMSSTFAVVKSARRIREMALQAHWCLRLHMSLMSKVTKLHWNSI